MPVTLADFGSFHVPGRTVERAGLPVRRLAVTPETVIDHDPNGRYAVEQLYVQYFVPAAPTLSVPLVLLHGGGMTGVTWETTPDGRPGWLRRFLEAGFPVHVIDTVERGRAGFCAVPGEWEQAPVARTDREAWSPFRFGLDADFDSRTPLPGQRFPLAAFEALQLQFVPRWLTTTAAQTDGLERALERIGRAVVLCHSQGGQAAQTVAARRPDLVAGVLAIEPSGFPARLDRDLGGMPWLIVMGDFLDRFALWRGLEARSRRFVDDLRAAGADAGFLHLPEQGIAGSTHLMMMDDNSDALADRLAGWLRERYPA